MTSIIAKWDVEDVAECNTGTRAVKYKRFEGPSYARLDRIYVSINIPPECTSYDVIPVSFSDHCLVFCFIGITKRNKSFSWELWKLNDNLLHDDIYNPEVKVEISKISPSEKMHLWQQWELCKEKLKLKAINRVTSIRYEPKLGRLS